MIEGVSDYNLIPLNTYSSNTGGKTTITGFDEMLKEKQASFARNNEKMAAESESTSTSREETGTSQTQTVTGDEDMETTRRNAAASVVFRDPVTGSRIRYVDVAGSDATTASEKVSKTENSSSPEESSSATGTKKTKYESYFQKASKKYGVSVSLLKAIAKAESGFNAKCVSSAGAMGVMQLMPATAQGLGVKDPYDPEQNIMGGAKCIASKLKEFHGDVSLALAAYNAGSGAVKRSGGIPSYTRSYISKVLSYQKEYET